MDVSRSMCATDIPPNRLVAAEEAASSFVENQDGGTQIGIVAFAGFAEMVQAPTNDEEVLLDVIASLATGRRTAIGSAILESIDAIAEIDPSIAAEHRRVRPGRAARRRPCRRAPTRRRSSCCSPMARATPARSRSRPRSRRWIAGSGSTRSGSGRRIRAADRRAAARSSVGREPGDNGQGFTTRGSAAAGSVAGAAGSAAAIDEETLTAVAEATGGEYYLAENAQQLIEVFAELPTDLITSHEVVEISVVFTAVAVVLIGLAILLGQAWRPLP